MAQAPSLPQCGGCLSNRQRVVPVYPSCKQRRLCDLVDPGLLRFHYGAESLEDYLKAQDLLLRGMNELRLRLRDPFPETEDAFVQQVKQSHYILFRHVLPSAAGSFRGPEDRVSYGGEGRGKREGYSHDRIEAGVRNAFHLATRTEWDHVRRSAAFLAHFFRVHPFIDGNGRIGRLLVQKICLANGKNIPAWNNTGKSRRRYISALEFAHPRHVKEPIRSLYFLEKWIGRHVQDLIEDEDAV